LEKKQITKVNEMARAMESELVVPLRKAWNITRYKRAPRAIQIIKDEVIRHLKVPANKDIYIDPEVNEAIWARGIENPPRKIKLTVINHEGDDMAVDVLLFKE
tara:strand:- start:1157 stop:1465 length:309 start_codon:yes stop_codon:yes gene_type:complete